MHSSSTSSAGLVKVWSYFLALATLFVLLPLPFGASEAQAQAWTLTKAQRQAYLQYYAPVILKRSDENEGKSGRDWLSNFDFDRDGNFSNNRTNWGSIGSYISAASYGPHYYYDRWRIRPTLYTSLIEYMEGGSKSLVLLYHVYNAADKELSEIHDWERVEIVVHGVSGTPGGGSEYVNHVTVTLHKEHHMRRYYDWELNFMQTATGRHVLLWQADELNWDETHWGPHGHELRFVKNTYSWIAGQVSSGASAEVNISNKDDKRNVHYVFVPEGSPSAVSAWGATALTYTNAPSMYSGADDDNTLPWYRVKRITYELQDLADIFPTHWQYNAWYTHWLSDLPVDVLLESPIVNESGVAEVSTGLQRFYARSKDSGKSSLTDGREGYPAKRWFYGSYSAELNPENPSGSDDFGGFDGFGRDSYGYNRADASGYYNSLGAFWWQHDYFVHSGVINSDDYREEGMWLRGAWYTAANGGFDGRWVQLFDDRVNEEAITPLTLTLTYPTNRCTERALLTATASGGQSPYTFTWTSAEPISGPNEPRNSAYVYSYATATVTVQSADGQTQSRSYTFTPYCSEGENLP